MGEHSYNKHVVQSLLFDYTETRDWAAYRIASERLESYRLGDFSPLDEAVTEHFNNTSGLLRAPIEVVSGACRDVGRLYETKPEREFTGLRSAQVEALAEFYERNGIDDVLAEADQAAHAQNLVIIAPEPLGPGRMRFTQFLPYEVAEVVFDDLLETRISEASKVVLRIPISNDEYSTIYGRRTYTRSEAWDESPGGTQQRGVFNAEGTNPYGIIPLIARREVQSVAKGEYLPPINEALLTLQETVCVSVSQIIKTCRYQAHGRRVITGTKSTPVQLTTGADIVFAFVGQDDAPPPVYNEFMAEPPVAAYWEAVFNLLETYERFAGLTPGALTRSTGITGNAKLVETWSSDRRVAARERRARQFEQDLLDLIMIMAPPLALVDGNHRDAKVRVDYHPIRPDANDLQSEQANAIRYANGTDSQVETVMRREGVTRKEACKRIERRKAENKHYGAPAGAVTQGMDKTAIPAGMSKPMAKPMPMHMPMPSMEME